MKAKIMHKSKAITATFIVTMSFIFIACIIPCRSVGIMVGNISILILGLTILIMLFSALFKTIIIIEDNIMSVSYVCFTYEIPIESITAMSFTHTQHIIKGRTEYRVNLEIIQQKENKSKRIILNDNATIFNMKLFSDYEQMPDEDIPLYNVYIYLKDITGL